MRYIATRPRVAKNEGMSHGLFGKLAPEGPLTGFEDWRDIARLVYQNSKEHITMYRSVVSFDEDVAAELLLTDQKAWQRYIENHIRTIAEKNGIRREDFQWAAALHREKGHPHLHVVFWDTSARVKNPFTPPAVPDGIRRQMIKDTFAEKIRAFGEEKNLAAADLRQISNDLVDEFERHLRTLGKDRYRKLRQDYDAEAELSENFDFADEALNQLADRVFKIKAALPPGGRIAYQLLPPAVKKQVDGLVAFMLKQTPELQKQKDEYVQSKLKMALLYGGSEEHLKAQGERFGAEADKIIANRILGIVKTLNRLDGEICSAEYHQRRRTFYGEQMLLEALSMLSALTDSSNSQFEDESRKYGGLSKEARKELYLKHQDKGFEH